MRAKRKRFWQQILQHRRAWIISVGCLLLLLITISPSASALPGAAYTVCASGCDYPAIQTAIDSVPPGSTINVLPGTYYENVYWTGKDLVLQGSGAAQTTIEAPSGGTVIEITGWSGPVSSASLIAGFTIQGGNTSGNGGGIGILWGASPRIEDNHIMGNQAGLFGGGIAVAMGASPAVANNVIEGNTAQLGGGVGMFGGGSPALQGNQILTNVATLDGGGMYVKDSGSNPTISENLIQGNTASHFGGGIIAGNQTAAVIEGNTIDSNTAGYDGGGVIIQQYSGGQLTNNVITNNQASADPSFNGIGGGVKVWGYSNPLISGNDVSGNYGYDGGGMYVENFSSPAITNNTVEGNTAESRGGGVVVNRGNPWFATNVITGNLSAASGGGVLVLSATPTFEENRIAHNESSAGDGGGIYFLGSGGAEFSHNTVSENRAAYGGGGLVTHSSSMTVSHNLVAGNTAGTWGGGLLIQSGSDASVVNNQIVGNGALAGGGGIYVGNASPALLNNSIVDNQALVQGQPSAGEGIYVYGSAGEGGSLPPITNNVVVGHSYGIFVWGSLATPLLSHNDFWESAVSHYGNVSPGTTDISADPLFANRPLGDVHLIWNSPAVDAGSEPAPADDFDGDTRPQDGNDDSVAVADMGADEFICLVLDINGNGEVDVEEIQMVADHWHTQQGAPPFSPTADRNGDGRVDLLDVILITSVWGQHC